MEGVSTHFLICLKELYLNDDGESQLTPCLHIVSISDESKCQYKYENQCVT